MTRRATTTNAVTTTNAEAMNATAADATTTNAVATRVAITTDATTRASVPLGARRWLFLSMAAAVIAFAGSLVALADNRIYVSLTPAFLPQALAQDISNLAVAPLLFGSAVWALRGSLRAYLVWLGVTAFTIYSYVIYAFSIPFGPLFSVWTSVLAVSLFSLIGGLQRVRSDDIARRYTSRRTVTMSAWILAVMVCLFAALWLSEDVPALLTGSTPRSVIDLAIPTNPVHILDYAFFLPAGLVTSIGLFRREPFAHVVAPAFFVLLALTCVPILVTPLVQESAGSVLGAVIAIGILFVTLAAVLIMLLRSIGPATPARGES